ncbi:RAF-like serine/threonine-protein kinase PRAF [Miscanthus floridulus]|uniref:RAF-like serine/threonine-protein kinase PRAF n=1 Tax=Miscanthus floridulus TaxID=154761 RepID=UPI003458D36B
MTSPSSHHPDSSSASSTPRAGVGNGNGGNHHHHLHPPPLPPAPAPAPAATPAQAQAQAAHGGPQVRLMCSFGGRILPRPGDRQLRYVGGETRIVSFPRAAASFAALVAALAKAAPALFAPGAPRPSLKYQLPQDDLDSLISVTSDDDVYHLMDELDRIHDLSANVARPPRLRVFLFAPAPDAAFGSVLSGTAEAAASTDQWFVDALNAPAPHPVERGRSEASSIISEVPDYLFGLDTASDEPSPGPAAARARSDAAETETPRHHGDDVPPSARQMPFVAEGASSWPAPPPPYMAQPVYYFPVPPPVHYLDPSAQGGYMHRPLYHIVGGGGSEAPGGDLHAAGGVYGVPHHMHAFPPMMYPPPRAVVYNYKSEGMPSLPPEGGAHSS